MICGYLLHAGRLTVRAPILRFREENNTRQPLDLLCDRATTSPEEGTTGEMARAMQCNSASPLLMNGAIFGQFPSPEDNTLLY